MVNKLDPVTLSKVLLHYKRRDIQNAIVSYAKNKEAVGSFGGKGYAKRPDVLVFANDVFEQVQTGVTSFHFSEELWSNPQKIQLNMHKNDYNALRIGWDLVLDIDCPVWEFSKITAWLFILALKAHGISAITAKFSGNKGFHIAVPFEAFPERINDQDTKDMFPDAPRKIASYLLEYISKKLVVVNGNKVIFGNKFSYSISDLAKKNKKDASELIKTVCASCGGKFISADRKNVQFSCPVCQSIYSGSVMDEYMKCPKCDVLMECSISSVNSSCCSKPSPMTFFDTLSIVDVDTVLIAQRHLYRAPYSFHEKSGLISIPIDPDKILDFEKHMAEQSKVSVGLFPFMDRSVDRGQAKQLLVESLDFVARKEHKRIESEELDALEKVNKKDFEELSFAVPESFFPPCIQIISKGLPDGRKRAVFLMINFLSSCGWSYDDIESWFKKWNERNTEALRDQYFLGQLRYARQHKKKILPPNCDNLAYYKAFGVCKPDNFCQYIKNPANYAIKKARYAQKNNKKNSKNDKDIKKKADKADNKKSELKSQTKKENLV